MRLFAARICSHLLRSLSVGPGFEGEDSEFEGGSISCKADGESIKV